MGAKMKQGLFTGTFDPPTHGHLDIIQRAASLCNKLYIAVASNGKAPNSLSQEKRIALLKKITASLDTVEVVPLNGLSVDLAKTLKVDCLIRGLRTASDFDYEMQMAAANRQMTGIETLCFIASPIHAHINGTLIRQIAAHGRRLEGFVPKEIENDVFEAFKKDFS